MKTRDKILYTSLLLFNEEGEPNVTTVDIANEMDISPGNLYYHFRGKDIIIQELYAQFDQSMHEILTAPIDRPLSIDDHWFYSYVVFEEIYKYRFFYRNLPDILQRHENIHQKFKKLLSLKIKTAKAICSFLAKNNYIVANEAEVDLLVNNIAMTITYWLNFEDLRANNLDESLSIHQGVYQIMSLIAPYFGEHQRVFYEYCQELYSTLIETTDNTN